MSKKILSGLMATVLTASTVATSIIPMTNYKPNSENLVANTTDVVETKKLMQGSTRAEILNLTNERIGKIQDFTVENKGITSSSGCIKEKFILQKGYYAVKGNVGFWDTSNWSMAPSDKALIDLNEMILVDNSLCANFGQISSRMAELQCDSFWGNPIVFYSDGKRVIEFWNKSVESVGHFGDLVKWDLTTADYIKPTITGTNNFVVNVNNMLSKEQILSHISARDETDGDIPVVIESSTYDPANKKTGDYNMVVSATDNAGNKTTVTITIKVVDIDKPTITGTNSYTTSYNKPISLDTIKSALTVTDNYDKNLQVQLIQDNYTANTNKVGLHTITFKAVDSSNNESDVFTVSINVEDKDKPVITGPATITVPSNKLFTLHEFKSKYTINDGLDGDITLTDGMITGYDNYASNHRKVGSYTVTINVSDKNGNTTTLSVTIKVEDKISPEIMFDDYFIVLEQGQSLSPEQIKEYASKALGISVDAITEVSGEYDTNVAGVYKLSVKTIDGQEHIINLNVTEKVEENLRPLKWYEYVYEWFLILFNIEPEYRTDSFWNFGTRWQSVVKVYSEHQILDNKLIK